MSIESQLQDLVTQTRQLDQTVKTELVDCNTDISKLRTRVTALEIRIGLPDGSNPNTIPGGGGGSSSNPNTNTNNSTIGNDVIQIDQTNNLIWLWNPETNSWVSIPFTEISPPIALDVQAIINQANAAIDAGIQDRLTALAASIAETVLETQQTQIDGLASQVTTLGTTVSGHTSAIQTEATARANADSAISSSVTDLVAQVSSNHQAYLSLQAAVVADHDGAAASYLQGMQAQLNTNTAAIQTEAATRASADIATSTQVNTLVSSVNATQSAIQQEVTARTSADSAISTSVTNLASRVGTAEGAIQNLQSVTSGLNSNTVSSITTLTSTVNGLTTTVQDVSTAVNGIAGKRSLAINANGRVTGIELLGGGTTGSQIKFQASQFIFYDPSTSVETAPFVIAGGATYLNKAVIKDADIDTLKIANNAVTVPVSVTRADTVLSTGDFTSSSTVAAISASITVPLACTLTYLYSAKNGYYGWNPISAPQTWNTYYKGELPTRIEIYVDGALIRTHGGYAVENTLTIAGALPVAAGTHTVEIRWKGQRYDTSACVNLMERTLTLLGAMK